LSLALGGPTYGWIHAAFTSLDKLQNLLNATSINIPVPVCTPTKDKVVSIKAQQQICHTLGWHQKFIEGSKHEILFERDTIRQYFWKTFDYFIEST
tara:strand:- start:337 stop:624 length:288 start_codon:yes stop_codon:yes gene_type:complete